MKKALILVAITAIAFVQNSFSQDNAAKSQYSGLLHSYYDIKNALVAGNSATASTSAVEFVNNIKAIGSKTVSDSSKEALVKDASVISKSEDLKKQREVFATFSINMYNLLKTSKPAADTVYYQYCPMKKAYWLSNEAAIKNPYYGNMMLTCGKVVETLK